MPPSVYNHGVRAKTISEPGSHGSNCFELKRPAFLRRRFKNSGLRPCRAKPLKNPFRKGRKIRWLSTGDEASIAHHLGINPSRAGLVRSFLIDAHEVTLRPLSRAASGRGQGMIPVGFGEWTQ